MSKRDVVWMFAYGAMLGLMLCCHEAISPLWKSDVILAELLVRFAWFLAAFVPCVGWILARRRMLSVNIGACVALTSAASERKDLGDRVKRIEDMIGEPCLVIEGSPDDEQLQRLTEDWASQGGSWIISEPGTRVSVQTGHVEARVGQADPDNPNEIQFEGPKEGEE